MAFLKFSASRIFDGRQFIDDDRVLILDPEGTVVDLVHSGDAGDQVMALDGMLIPGFVNCHCHLELSHMKGLIPERTGLVQFVSHIVQHRHMAEEDILDAISKGEDEMLENGIVAVGDICNNQHTLAQKTKGRIWYHNFIEVSGFTSAVADARFNSAVELFRAFGARYGIPVASNSIVPHAPYSVADALWDRIIQFPGNQLMTIHNQETPAEEELFRFGSGEFFELYKRMKIDVSGFIPPGTSSLRQFLPKFLPNQPVILVHNVHTSEADIDFSRQTAAGNQLYWCLCPNANRYIGGQLPDIDLLISKNCQVVLGTDSLASNHQLSILAELQTIRSQYPLLPLAQLLHWATLAGAKALQLDNLLGSFEAGKNPGVLLCDSSLTQVRRLV